MRIYSSVRPNIETINTRYDGFVLCSRISTMDFLLLGNHPFLDFINTLPVHGGEEFELIGDGGTYLNLLGRLDIKNRPSLRKLGDREGIQISALAREMREDFRRFLLANDEGSSGPSVIDVVNGWFERLGPPSIAREGDQFVLNYQSNESEKIAPEICVILRSGLELVTSPAFSKVRKCANPQCVLWYLDTTKSRTRRWCSMTMCGNVEKARSFRERHQAKKTS